MVNIEHYTFIFLLDNHQRVCIYVFYVYAQKVCVYNAHDNTHIGRRSSHKSRDIHDGTEKKQVHREILRIDNIMRIACCRKWQWNGRGVEEYGLDIVLAVGRWINELTNRYLLWRHYMLLFYFFFDCVSCLFLFLPFNNNGRTIMCQ